jgi:hypothetical protein
MLEKPICIPQPRPFESLLMTGHALPESNYPRANLLAEGLSAKPQHQLLSIMGGFSEAEHSRTGSRS